MEDIDYSLPEIVVLPQQISQYAGVSHSDLSVIAAQR
jgi:hypothetical protein